jgi:hypothetical protein
MLLSFLLALAMVVGMLPGMSMTAYDPIFVEKLTETWYYNIRINMQI